MPLSWKNIPETIVLAKCIEAGNATRESILTQLPFLSQLRLTVALANLEENKLARIHPNHVELTQEFFEIEKFLKENKNINFEIEDLENEEEESKGKLLELLSEKGINPSYKNLIKYKHIKKDEPTEKETE
jgi:hypothetical protein